jgi:hypothetical protein
MPVRDRLVALSCNRQPIGRRQPTSSILDNFALVPTVNLAFELDVAAVQHLDASCFAHDESMHFVKSDALAAQVAVGGKNRLDRKLAISGRYSSITAAAL